VEALASRNDSGLGAMTRLFVDGLRGMAGDADIRVLLPRNGSYRPGGHCLALPVEPRPLRFWTEVRFPLIIRSLKPDAVFCLGQTLPRLRPAGRYALAIPDAGPLERLGLPASSHDSYNRAWLRRAARQADAVITISEFTRSRLSELLGIPRERIRVVHPVRPASPVRPLAETPLSPLSEAIPESQDYPQGDYFLSLGNVEPRKNYPGLIAAYALLKRRRPDAPPLYIAGHKAWGFREAADAVDRHGLSGSVHFTGYLSDAARQAYLAHCRLYVSSSLYEGWGLPLFEALAQGRPAIYHGGGSQEEFAAGSALAVDCRAPAALAAAMESLWTDARERERLQSAAAGNFRKWSVYDLEGALRRALIPLLG
jgi:glycosyltransferase involved in cell wall biosynthesis